MPAATPRRAIAPLWRDFALALLLILTLAATVFIWLQEPMPQRLKLVATGIVWTIAMTGLLARLQGRRTIHKLEAVLAHDEIVHSRLQPDITEAQSGLRMKHVSAWLVAALGIMGSAVLWQTGAIERAVGGSSTFIAGAAVSIMFGLIVAANAVNRLKTRRLMRDFRAALNSEQLALGTLGAVDVLISACLPTGERTRFNEHFLHFVGKTAAQMQGHGWLDVVHPDDRQAALDLVAKPLTTKKPRIHDLCVRHRDGDFVWLHEALAPRLDAKGELIEFIGTAINITSYVENEASLDKQIGDLKTDLGDVKTKLDDARSELSKTKASRNRFEKNLEESRAEAKSLQEALAKTETTLAKAKVEAIAKIKEIDGEAKERVKAIERSSETAVAKLEDALKSARQEHLQAAAENKKLDRAFEKLQEEMGQLRQQDGDRREQLARHMKETREAKAEAGEAHTIAAQHRAKSDRLTQRCDELEAQLAVKAKELSEAQIQVQEASATIVSEVERRLHEVSAEAMATQLRKQLDGVQRMVKEMLATTLDGPVQDAAHNTAATVGAMSDLVDQALHRASPQPKGRSASPASFDLRRTAQGVRDLLIDSAKAKGVTIDLQFASNLPALVHGDDIEVRTAMMSLTDAVLNLTDDGTLIMRLSEEISTGAHSTIRGELRHASTRVKADALEAALALKCTDDAMPDAIKHPQAHQAARAWNTIRRLQGQHGFLLPDEGGFLLWFTFTLGRPAASARPDTSRSSVSAAGDAISSAPEVQSDTSDSRQMPRMPQELLKCNLGEVVELGGDSIRIYCAKPPKTGEAVIKFEDVETDLELRAEVLWSKKIAGRKHDVGLKFLSLMPESQKRLLRIAMQHRKVKTMQDVE